MWREFFSETNTGIPTTDGETVGLSFYIADATVLKVRPLALRSPSVSRVPPLPQDEPVSHNRRQKEGAGVL